MRDKLTASEASRYLDEKHGVPIAPKTLSNKASTGGGPRFVKVAHRRLYPVSELDTFAASITSPLVGSTSELQASAA